MSRIPRDKEPPNSTGIGGEMRGLRGPWLKVNRPGRGSQPWEKKAGRDAEKPTGGRHGSLGD